MDIMLDKLDHQIGKGRVTRRQFLKFCGLMAATLALENSQIGRIAVALSSSPRPPVLWLEFQGCTGDTESFLRSNQPTLDDFLLNQISLNYHETLMVPSGAASELSLTETISQHSGEFIAIVEGSIPLAQSGVYCTIGGRTAKSMIDEVAQHAKAIIAAGSCAWDGGLAAAAPNPTQAGGVRDAVPGFSPLVNLPGCPVNSVNLAATLVHYLTYGTFPSLDGYGRPHSMYGTTVHYACERRGEYSRDHKVEQWGDYNHRHGGCLEEMGCKGPDTKSNCPTVKWNGATSWPVQAGHHCVGCTSPHFWDSQSPFYEED